MPTVFDVIDKEHIVVKCRYCEQAIAKEEIKLK